MKGYTRMLELLHLSGIQRTTALQLIEGLEVEQSESSATIRFLTVVPFFKVHMSKVIQFTAAIPCKMHCRDWFSLCKLCICAQVTEELDFNKEVPQGRRDLRPGKQLARCKRLPKGLYVEMNWGEPLAGRLTETYHMDGNNLYVESSIDVQDGSATAVVVQPQNPRPPMPKLNWFLQQRLC